MLPTVRIGMWKDRDVAILGVGRANLPLADYLLRAGARLTLYDRTPKKDAAASVQALARRGASLCFGEDYLQKLEGEVIFRTPGIPAHLPALREAVLRGAYLSDEAELFMALCPAKILAVTGSDGKTTTATLTHRILRQEYGDAGVKVYLGGNIGVSLFPVLPEIRATDLVVLELSSFQLEGITPKVHRACITNLTENHLDHHGSMDAYRAAKENLLKGSIPILSADDPATREIAARTARPVLFSATHTAEEVYRDFPDGARVFTAEGEDILSTSHDGTRRRLFKKELLHLSGVFHLQNLLASVALCDGFASLDALRTAVAAFHGVAHRMQTVACRHGVTYIDSSIDTTPTRTATTLTAISGMPIVICGGRGKGLSYVPLAEALAARAKAVVFTGEDGKKMQSELYKIAPTLPAFYRTAFADAVYMASTLAGEGDTVLLSPAATSYDAFRDYEERGRSFASLTSSM